MEFEWVNIRDKLITKELLDVFQSGNSVFDKFLQETASVWQDYSESATYVFVDKSEIDDNKITRIFGYVSINTTGLMYYNENGNRLYLPCAEIRMFAIHKSLRKRHDISNKFSQILFKLVLQNLYFMSTHIIGFRAIFLNSNDDGYQLYSDCGFEDLKDFLAPEEEEKLSIKGTKPMILLINDNITDIIFS